VGEQTTELEASRRELDALLYSVSHDLRAPLRAIDGFSQALLDDHSDKLDDEGLIYLSRLHAAAGRMGVMIDELVRLARLSRSELERADVDLSAVAREVARGLQLANADREVAVRIQDGIHATGDPKLLRVIMESLLDNAWKFTARRPQAQVEVQAARRHGERIYSVRDDGVGFDMRYAERLFGPFQRMHPEREFSGSGIGLALAQRIVRRHGGRIWASAQVDAGATFYFTLERKRA